MKKVIIAEDDTFLRNMMSDYLEGRGFKVAAFSGGAKAREAAETERADILITDILMEDGEGISTIHSLRRSERDIAIIAVSSNDRYLKYARSIGADYTMQKPIKCRELLRAVHAL